MATIGRAFTRQRDFGLSARPVSSLGQAILSGPLTAGSNNDGTELARINPRFQQILRKRLRQARYRIHRRHSMEVSSYESPLKVITSSMSPKNKGASWSKTRGTVKHLLGVFDAFSPGRNSKGGKTPLFSPMNQSVQSPNSKEEGQGGQSDRDLNKMVMGQTHHRRFFCYPETSYKMYWDTFMAVLVIYTCLNVPFRIGFAVEAVGVGVIFEKLINYIFMMDILVTFRTPYSDERGVLVSDPWKIAYRYIRGDLFIDLISSIPFDSVLSGSGGSSSSIGRSVMLLRALRLTRLLRLFRVTKMRRIWEDNESTLSLSNNTNRSIRIGVTLLVMAHLLGSAWHGVSLLVKDVNHTWVTVLIAAHNGSSKIGLTIRYISSVYYAFTSMTTVGYGDILAINDHERLYAIVVMLFGGMVFGLVVGNVTAVIQNFNPVETHYREQIQEIKAYMRSRNIPRLLYQRVKAYFEYHYQDFSVLENPQDILDKLTGPVAMQLNFVHHDRMIRRIPFLHLQQPSFSVAIAKVLKPLLLFRNEMLYYQDDLGTSFYFIVKGTLRTHAMVEEDEDTSASCMKKPPLILEYGTVPQESFTGEVRWQTSAMRCK